MFPDVEEERLKEHKVFFSIHNTPTHVLSTEISKLPNLLHKSSLIVIILNHFPIMILYGYYLLISFFHTPSIWWVNIFHSQLEYTYSKHCTAKSV